MTFRRNQMLISFACIGVDLFMGALYYHLNFPFCFNLLATIERCLAYTVKQLLFSSLF
uniref:Uncharacterized protein n=1 Tax=Arundo donax TaxID=35708 RepID=A0A0A9HMZ1_ARUDO